MRRLLPVCFLVLAGGLVGLRLAAVLDGDASRQVARSERRRPGLAARALPVPAASLSADPHAEAPARLVGSSTAPRAPTADARAVKATWLVPTCATDVVARLLHGGSSIERVWGEYVSSQVDPGRRGRIDQVALRLETSPPDPFWQPRVGGSPAPVRARLRLLEVSETFLRDHGLDTGGLSHLQLDADERRVLDDAVRGAEPGIRLEDEHSLPDHRRPGRRRLPARHRDVAAARRAPPRAPRRGGAPARRSVRRPQLPPPSESWCASPARSPRTRGQAATDGVAIRQSARCSITMETGRTVLLVMRGPIWVPPRASRRADRAADSWVPIVLARMDVE